MLPIAVLCLRFQNLREHLSNPIGIPMGQHPHDKVYCIIRVYTISGPYLP